MLDGIGDPAHRRRDLQPDGHRRPSDLGRPTRRRWCCWASGSTHGPADHVVDRQRRGRRRPPCPPDRARPAARRRGRRAAHPEGGATARLRLPGYRQALHGAGLPDDPAWSCATDSLAPRRRGRRGAAGCSPPDAAGRRVLLQRPAGPRRAARAARARACGCPSDVAVVGFDDIEDGRWSVPTLTTISPDKPGLAQLAVDLLAEHIDRSTPDGPQAGSAAALRELRGERPSTWWSGRARPARRRPVSGHDGFGQPGPACPATVGDQRHGDDRSGA